MKRRTMIACGIIALLFVLLIGRLIYFSIFKNGIYKRQVQKATIDALHKYMKLDEDKLLKFIKRHKDSYYSVYREELSYSQIADLKDFIASDKAENVSGIVFNEK